LFGVTNQEERHRLFNIIIKSTIGEVKLMIASELPRIEMLEFLSKSKSPAIPPQLGESPVSFELAAQSATILR
jgi:hypothetical protein